MNESELKDKAKRHRLIESCAKAVSKRKANAFTKRRREVEYQRDLKGLGVSQ